MMVESTSLLNNPAMSGLGQTIFLESWVAGVTVFIADGFVGIRDMPHPSRYKGIRYSSTSRAVRK